jgi:peptidoglycan/LPS O-acetylase OafA/YrhL
MIESQAEVVAQFDAVIEAQHSARLASLRRKATSVGWQVWLALPFFVLALLLMAVAYHFDQHVSLFDHRISLLTSIGLVLAAACAVLAGDVARRRRAAKELEKEYRAQPQQPP